MHTDGTDENLLCVANVVLMYCEQMAPTRTAAVVLLAAFEAIHVSCFTPAIHPPRPARALAITKTNTVVFRDSASAFRHRHAPSVRAGATAMYIYMDVYGCVCVCVCISNTVATQ